jgi:phenylacetate-CoA ligase
MLIVSGVNVWPSAVKDVVASLEPRTTGALQILLARPGPRVDPPLRIQVEHGAEASELHDLRREIERLLRDKLIVRAEVTLVPPGTLPRFEMKAEPTHR